MVRLEPKPVEARRKPTIPDRWRDPLAVGLAAAGVLGLLSMLVIWRTSPGWGYDFAAYYNAAVRLVETGSPYQDVTLSGPFRPGPGGLYLYSPVVATLLLPATQMPFDVANTIWQVLRVGMLVLTCALIPASGRIRLLALAVAVVTPPALDDLNLGNVSVVVTFFAVLAWRYLDRPFGGVAIAAALTIRPTMAVVDAWWLLRGRLGSLFWSVAAYAVIAALTLPFVGLGGWIDYLTVLRNLGDITGVARNWDMGSFFLNLGLPSIVATLAVYAGYAIAVGAVLLSLRRDRELGYVVAVMASLILSPLLWNHYMSHLIIPAAFLAKRGRPWGLALPLLTWLPQPLLGFVAVFALLITFAAQAPDQVDPDAERSGWPHILARLRLRRPAAVTA